MRSMTNDSSTRLRYAVTPSPRLGGSIPQLSSDVSLAYPVECPLSSDSEDGSRGFVRGGPTRWKRWRLPPLRVLLALNAALLTILIFVATMIFSGTMTLSGSQNQQSFDTARQANMQLQESPAVAVSRQPAPAALTPAALTPAEGMLPVMQPMRPISPPVEALIEFEDESGDVAGVVRHHSAERLLSTDAAAVAHYTADRSTPFMWPRPSPRSPSSSLFVTSMANIGAGIGHQFGEWIYGPWVALRFNATYLHSDWGGNGARWNRFLGFSEGEDRVEDFFSNFGATAGKPYRTGITQIQMMGEQQNGFSLLVRSLEQEAAPKGRSWHWIPPFLETQRVDSLARMRKLATQGFQLTAPPSANHAMLDPQLPTPTLVYFDAVHIHAHDAVCGPDTRMLLTLRRKYCRARVVQPRMVDLYAADRARNSVVIALHLRCGDSCYDSFRTTTFDSVAHTVQRMYAVLSMIEPDRPIAFHVFSQKPLNNTAEAHFAPLLAMMPGVAVTTHFAASAFVVLHHLVRSDVLLGAQSSFSWLAFILHHGVSMGPFKSCTHSVDYAKDTGIFDEAGFEREFQDAKRIQLKYDTWQDCVNIQPHVVTRELLLEQGP